jgi:hypothetical protein
MYKGKERLTSTARKKYVPRALFVRTDGSVVEDGKRDQESVLCHFVAAPFRFCLRCGVSYSTYLDNDFEKLAQLSSEGRTTATTSNAPERSARAVGELVYSAVADQ